MSIVNTAAIKDAKVVYEKGMRELEVMYRKNPDLLESDEAERIRDELDAVWPKLDPEVRRRIEKKVRCPEGCILVEEEQPK